MKKTQKKMPKVGDEITFEIRQNMRENPIVIKGKVAAVNNNFGGHIYVEKGATTEEQFIIRRELIK